MVERQVEVLIKNLAIFFLLPSKEPLLISFKIQLLETSPQKENNKQHFEFNAIFTWKGFEECVREEIAHLATLKTKSI